MLFTCDHFLFNTVSRLTFDCTQTTYAQSTPCSCTFDMFDMLQFNVGLSLSCTLLTEAVLVRLGCCGMAQWQTSLHHGMLCKGYA